MYLKIYVENPSLRLQYIDAIKKHNEKMEKPFPDSGFDLYCPEEIIIPERKTAKINLGIKCAAFKLVEKSDWKIQEDAYGTIYKNIKTNTTHTLSEISDKNDLEDKYKPMPFYLYARSSIGKTPLRLANNVGIIDSGYRGEIGAYVDNIHSSPDFNSKYTIAAYTRLFQICDPNLEPIKVEIVEKESDLGKTVRGSGGFGSTGV